LFDKPYAAAMDVEATNLGAPALRAFTICTRYAITGLFYPHFFRPSYVRALWKWRMGLITNDTPGGGCGAYRAHAALCKVSTPINPYSPHALTCPGARAGGRTGFQALHRAVTGVIRSTCTKLGYTVSPFEPVIGPANSTTNKRADVIFSEPHGNIHIVDVTVVSSGLSEEEMKKAFDVRRAEKLKKYGPLFKNDATGRSIDCYHTFLVSNVGVLAEDSLKWLRLRFLNAPDPRGAESYDLFACLKDMFAGIMSAMVVALSKTLTLKL
jgi:hypothetical protein